MKESIPEARDKLIEVCTCLEAHNAPYRFIYTFGTKTTTVRFVLPCNSPRTVRIQCTSWIYSYFTLGIEDDGTVLKIPQEVKTQSDVVEFLEQAFYMLRDHDDWREEYFKKCASFPISYPNDMDVTGIELEHDSIGNLLRSGFNGVGSRDPVKLYVEQYHGRLGPKV